jgi:hypothetical protein
MKIKKDRFFFPNDLVMFRAISDHTLIIMIDTSIYTDEDVTCFPQVGSTESNSEKSQQLRKHQHDLVLEKLNENDKDGRPHHQRCKNIIVCGHHPLAGFKNQKTKKKKTEDGKVKIKIKGGLDVLPKPDLYELLLEIKDHADHFFYLCADIHNYQRGTVTLSSEDKIKTITLEQRIVGIGGTTLDDDYNEMYDPNYAEYYNTEGYTAPIHVKDATVNLTGGISIAYHIDDHFSEKYGYLVGIIRDDGDAEFSIKTVYAIEKEST